MLTCTTGECALEMTIFGFNPYISLNKFVHTSSTLKSNYPSRLVMVNLKQKRNGALHMKIEPG